MRVFERVPHEVAKARMRNEPIKVRWVDTLKGSGTHRSRLVAKEFRRGSKCEGFANFSAAPPLELVKLIISLVATAQRDPESRFGWREHGANDQIAMTHTDISHANFHAPSKEEKYVELTSEKWRSEYPEYGRLRVSLLGTRDAAANWEDAYAKVLTEHGFARGVASPRSFCCKERGIKVVVHGDDFLSGGLNANGIAGKVVDKHFEAKHTVMGESRSLKKSIVMLNRRISWRDNVRAGHETLPKNCRSIESATSKNSGITSSRGKRDWSATRRMLMGIPSKSSDTAGIDR